MPHKPSRRRTNDDFEDGPTLYCCGAPCFESQIWLFRFLLIMPWLYALWYVLVLIFTAAFGVLPVDGLEPFKHEHFLLRPNATEANGAVAFAAEVGRTDDGGREYRPLVAWLSLVLSHVLVAPWLVCIAAHDPKRVFDYCMVLQITHLILTTVISADVPSSPVWWGTTAVCFVVQSQLAFLYIARLPEGRAMWVRRVASGPFGSRRAIAISVTVDDAQPLKPAVPPQSGRTQNMSLPPIQPRREIATSPYGDYLP